MARPVFAMFDDDPETPMLFAWRAGQGWMTGDEPPSTGVKGRDLTVFVPGFDVLSLTAAIPARGESEARRAAPFAVEDDVGVPVESLHVALGPRGQVPEMPRLIHVVSQEKMEAWLRRLEKAGLPEAVLVADHGVLPEGALLLECPRFVLARIKDRTFALDGDVASDVLASLLETGADTRIFGDGLARRMGMTGAGPGCATNADLLIQLAEWSDDAGVNLRQGTYAARRQIDLAGMRQLPSVLAMASVIFVLFIAGLLVETWALEKRAGELSGHIAERVEEEFPEAGGDRMRALTIAHAEMQARQALRPSTLLAVLFEALREIEGADLRSVRYEASTGRVNAVIGFRDYAGADQLRAAIEATGLASRVADARQSGDRVLGELILEPKP